MNTDLLWSAPFYHQTDILIHDQPHDGSNVFLYFVDTCGEVAQLTGTSVQSISEMGKYLRGPNFPPAAVVKRDICSLMALMPVGKHPAESMKLCGMLSGLGIRLISEHPVYKQMCKIHSAQHWIFLGFRLFDCSYICEPIAINDDFEQRNDPIPWPGLMHLLPAIIAAKTQANRSLGATIKKSGGAILAPSFKTY